MSNPTRRYWVLKDNRIAKSIAPFWLGESADRVVSIRDLRRNVNMAYSTTAPWRDGEQAPQSALAMSLLTPITAVLPDVTEELGPNSEETLLGCVHRRS